MKKEEIETRLRVKEESIGYSLLEVEFMRQGVLKMGFSEELV